MVYRVSEKGRGDGAIAIGIVVDDGSPEGDLELSVEAEVWFKTDDEWH